MLRFITPIALLSGTLLLGAITVPNTPLLPPRPPTPARDLPVYCNASSQCPKASVLPNCASAVICDTNQPAPTGFNGVCVYALNTSAGGCRCYDTQIRYCDANGPGSCAPPNAAGCGIQTCVATSATSAEWANQCVPLPPQPGPCGASGQACCGAGACNASLTCNGAQCAPCGAANQPCCKTSCNNGLACQGAVCGAVALPPPCGGNGQSCCSGGACGANLSCQGTTCAPCGWNAQVCCPGGGCHSGLSCQGGRCSGPPQLPVCGAVTTVVFQQSFKRESFWGVSENHTFGDAYCGAGTERGECTATKTINSPPDHSHCEAHWENVTNPNDCRCTAHFGAKSGATLLCDVKVTKHQVPCR